MKIEGKAEREQRNKVELIKKIAFIIVVAIVIYCFLYFVLIDSSINGYKRDESLNVSYDLNKDLIPAPIQKTVANESFVEKVRGVDITITKLASYDITGKVEAIQVYNTNPIASILSFKGTNVFDYISPIDFTLSWGEIALNENSNHISCDQYYMNTDRVVWTSWDKELQDKYSESFITSHFSNNHVISLNSGIRTQFSKVKVSDIIRMQGYLVSVNTSNNLRWGPSSLTRTDTGMHACEIMYVEKFIIMK